VPVEGVLSPLDPAAGDAALVGVSGATVGGEEA
jgi:hypothetical protein